MTSTWEMKGIPPCLRRRSVMVSMLGHFPALLLLLLLLLVLLLADEFSVGKWSARLTFISYIVMGPTNDNESSSYNAA